MPYSNVPRHLWGKMDSCVQQVMAREGVDKKRAIAMCHASLVKEAEVASSKDRRQGSTRSEPSQCAMQA